MKQLESLVTAEELAALLGSYGDSVNDSKKEQQSWQDDTVQKPEDVVAEEGDIESSVGQ